MPHTPTPIPQDPNSPDTVDSPDEWEDYNVPPDPPGTWDNTYPSRPSPTDDSLSFAHLVNRTAIYHGVKLESDPVEEDFLLDTFEPAQKSTCTLPMLKGVIKHAPDIFKDPVRARIVNPRIEKKYKPCTNDPVYIRGQMPLDSLVVSNARKRANSQTTGDAPPPDKESKLIDAAGKRVSLQAASAWRIANTQALIARYDRAHYDQLEKLMQHLPDKYRDQANDLIQEGKIISNASIKCALDAADTASRTVNTSVMLRRHAWLRISVFMQEVQANILNQPFNQEQLFGPAVDSSLEKMKKDTETAKSMGALQTPSQRGSFRCYSYRGAQKGSTTDISASSYKTTPQNTTKRGFYSRGYRGKQQQRKRSRK